MLRGAICAHQTSQSTNSFQDCSGNHSGKICTVAVQLSNHILEDYLTSGGPELLLLRSCDVYTTESQLSWSKSDFILAMQRAWRQLLGYIKSAQQVYRLLEMGSQSRLSSTHPLQYSTAQRTAVAHLL